MAKSPDKDKTPVDLLAEAVEAIEDRRYISASQWRTKHADFRTCLLNHPLQPLSSATSFDRELATINAELALRQAKALIYIFKHSFISTKL